MAVAIRKIDTVEIHLIDCIHRGYVQPKRLDQFYLKFPKIKYLVNLQNFVGKTDPNRPSLRIPYMRTTWCLAQNSFIPSLNTVNVKVSLMNLSSKAKRHLYVVTSTENKNNPPSIESTTSSDAQVALMLRIAESQCADSYKAIFAIYAPKVLAYGLANKLSDSAARDLTQEVMTLVWTKSKLYRAEKGNVANWIFTIARNQKFDLLRKNVREHKAISSVDLWELDASSSNGSPSHELELKISNQELSKHIEALPPTQAEALTAIYYDGLTQEEFAQKAGLPLGTVKSRIHLAMQKLSSLLRST